MPVHDWTRVIPGIFHDFHQTWIPEIKNALNDGLLPEGYYALAEQVAEGRIPDVIALERFGRGPQDEAPLSGGAIALADAPPRVKFTEHLEREAYARAADRVAVYHASGHQVVAYIEVVSPGNKHSRFELRRFLEKLTSVLEQGCHLLVVDVLPPGRHDPRGVHAAFWEERSEASHGVTDAEPVGLAAYRAAWAESVFAPTAYFEPVALGSPLPDMPLFLTENYYVNVPLEATYELAWRKVPRYWQDVVTGNNPD